MKLTGIPMKEAQKIIVYGKDKGFSNFTYEEQFYTVYHREYENKYYDILEMETYLASKNDTVLTYYILDPKEVKQLLGKGDD